MKPLTYCEYGSCEHLLFLLHYNLCLFVFDPYEYHPDMCYESCSSDPKTLTLDFVRILFNHFFHTYRHH